jgi:hypothetical protein
MLNKQTRYNNKDKNVINYDYTSYYLDIRLYQHLLYYIFDHPSKVGTNKQLGVYVLRGRVCTEGGRVCHRGADFVDTGGPSW